MMEPLLTMDEVNLGEDGNHLWPLDEFCGDGSCWRKINDFGCDCYGLDDFIIQHQSDTFDAPGS